MPRGTTQVVTRGASNDWCQMCRYEVRGGRASVRGTVAVRGVSTRQSEVSVHVSTRSTSGQPPPDHRSTVVNGGSPTGQNRRQRQPAPGPPVKRGGGPHDDNPSNDIRDKKALDTMQTWCELIIQQKVKEKQEETNIAEKAADHRTNTPEYLDSFKLTYKKSSIPLNNTPHSLDFFDFPPQPQYETYSLTQQHEQVVQKEQEEQAAFTPYWKIPIIDDDDDEYTIQYKEYLENSSNAITPDLPTKGPDNSLSMGDEHLSTILETKSDEVIKSSVKDLVPIPSESEGIFDDMCDVPFCDNSPPLDSLNDHFEIFSDFNNDCTSSDDDYGEDIDYVEASPPDSELVILEEVKDDILHEKLLNINLLIAKIESLNDNSTPDCVFKSPIPVKDFL
ncbi:hypothetical protein Tco_0695398 [Tanacetum coccineum]